MTKYEELMNKSDECCLKAIDFAKKNDWNIWYCKNGVNFTNFNATSIRYIKPINPKVI